MYSAYSAWSAARVCRVVCGPWPIQVRVEAFNVFNQVRFNNPAALRRGTAA